MAIFRLVLRDFLTNDNRGSFRCRLIVRTAWMKPQEAYGTAVQSER